MFYLKTKLKKEKAEPVSGTNQLKLTAPDGPDYVVLLAVSKHPLIKRKSLLDIINVSKATLERIIKQLCKSSSITDLTTSFC